MEKYSFLVTGGAGFIGSNICYELMSAGHFVKCLDDFSLGKRKNIEDLVAKERFELLEGDIRNFDICKEACYGVDFVLHQAAWGSVPRSITYPLKYEEINLRGTLNIFEASLKQGVKKCVYASSSSVYGDSEELPRVEHKIGNLLSPYALTKRVCEDYGRLYKTLYGLDTYGLRYFNVFGKNQNPSGDYAAVIPKFIKFLLDDIPPTIHGDGLQSRDFTYVSNVVQANINACFAPSECAGDVYNIACGSSETLNDVYYNICTLLGKSIKPIFAEARRGDVKHSNADISKAKLCLDYHPLVFFSEGLKMTIDWYKESLRL